MDKVIVKIKSDSGILPQYETEGAAGMDLRANIDAPIVLAPLQRVLVPTGLYIALPEGYEAQVRPRSGLAIKKGITVLNSPGTIDAGYRGEVGVIMYNGGTAEFPIRRGDRIAQMVITALPKVKLVKADLLNDSTRGSGGFGSTGKN